MKRHEVYTFQIQEKTLPGWLRGHGYVLLIGEFLNHWQGPEPQGLHVVHAASVHLGKDYSSEGFTLWFLLPDGQEPTFPPERLQTAAVYVFERWQRKAHEPGPGFTSIVLEGEPPAGNN